MALSQLALNGLGGGCPTPGSIQGEAGQTSEDPHLAEDVPCH